MLNPVSFFIVLFISSLTASNKISLLFEFFTLLIISFLFGLEITSPNILAPKPFLELASSIALLTLSPLLTDSSNTSCILSVAVNASRYLASKSVSSLSIVCTSSVSRGVSTVCCRGVSVVSFSAFNIAFTKGSFPCAFAKLVLPGICNSLALCFSFSLLRLVSSSLLTSSMTARFSAVTSEISSVVTSEPIKFIPTLFFNPNIESIPVVAPA